MESDNGKCGVGIAYEASIGGKPTMVQPYVFKASSRSHNEGAIRSE